MYKIETKKRNSPNFTFLEKPFLFSMTIELLKIKCLIFQLPLFIVKKFVSVFLF